MERIENRMTKRKILTQGNKNWFTLLLLITAVLGIFWGAVVKVEAGVLYLSVFVVGMLLILLSMLWVNEEDKRSIKDFFLSPITSDPLLSMGSYLIGWVVILFLKTVGFFTQTFSTTQFFSPLYLSSGGLTAISQSFQAGVIESSDLGTIFYSIFVAGTIEEYVWAYALPIVFFILALGFISSLSDSPRPLGFERKNLAMFFAVGMSVLTFMYIHKLNATYVGTMFLVAGLFRLGMNVLIYVYGMVLAFGIGMHQANNAIAYIEQFGFQRFLEALIGSPFGWFLMFIFVGAIFYVLTRYDEFRKRLRKELAKHVFN